MCKKKLTLLVMTSEDNMRHWDVAEKDKFVVEGSVTIKPWEHKSLAPLYLEHIKDSKLAGKIYDLAHENGRLGKVRQGLEIYFIPEGGQYDGLGSLTRITTDEFGEQLTYLLTGDLKGLIPSITQFSGNAPVILCWTEK